YCNVIRLLAGGFSILGQKFSILGRTFTLYLLINAFIPLIFSHAMAQRGAEEPEISELRTTVRSLTVEDGLPQGYINAIVQDSVGFIWLGTRDGLARYDGYQVKTFHYDPLDSSTISSDVIQAIYLDRENRMWVLHENRALDIFDPLTGKARRVGADDPLGWLLDERATEPFALRQDSRGTYWSVSPDLRRIRHFTSQDPRPVPVINPRKENIIALQEGLDGAMYVCTDRAFYMIR